MVLIRSELLIRDVILRDINYYEFRNIRIDKAKLDKVQEYTHNLLMSYDYIESHPYIDETGYLTYAMMLSEYNMLDNAVPNEKLFLRGIGRVSKTNAFLELYSYYKGIFSDIRYFPIPLMGKDAHGVSYEDSWNARRSYGGNRKHEGTDIMAGNNIRGYFPIISITDGIVEKMGWLEQGGYRIGIRSKAGAYFYYAHLDTYAPELKIGDSVTAGQLLGFMGDSGYGSEGTIGQFDVHLHLGIYVPSESCEISVNPYWILRILENCRTQPVY
ncbi:MAG TPA: M23 family metallopeptidase [Clostridiales bacterium]|nr:M23 family metallopeptidase [Clostridiales bacterium]